ncbi:hypothetical protein HJG60_010986 [Phyllostomus discolor]|uniref:Uncharacterized protein n=1 Tax=Phyllostomus discolor TaxID=89673 RepID=A0A834AEZ9_9CHIR|nr:hypothetical protein HJG60_010986 [Phyllostomus discolor]
MVERGKVAPLFHRSTWSFLREKGLGPCGRWGFPRGDLQDMGTQSVTWTAREDRGPSRGGLLLGRHMSDGGKSFLPLILGCCPTLGFPKSRPETRAQGQISYWEMQEISVEKRYVIQGRDSSRSHQLPQWCGLGHPRSQNYPMERMMEPGYLYWVGQKVHLFFFL